MIWVMSALIIAALVYVLCVVTKYNSTMRVAQNKIRSLQEKSNHLNQTVQHEKTVTNQKVDLLRGLKNEESEVRQEVALTEQKLKTAQIQEISLEMDMYKH